jgi:hypothetical protein
MQVNSQDHRLCDARIEVRLTDPEEEVFGAFYGERQSFDTMG